MHNALQFCWMSNLPTFSTQNCSHPTRGFNPLSPLLLTDTRIPHIFFFTNIAAAAAAEKLNDLLLLVRLSLDRTKHTRHTSTGQTYPLFSDVARIFCSFLSLLPHHCWFVCLDLNLFFWLTFRLAEFWFWLIHLTIDIHKHTRRHENNEQITWNIVPEFIVPLRKLFSV